MHSEGLATIEGEGKKNMKADDYVSLEMFKEIVEKHINRPVKRICSIADFKVGNLYFGCDLDVISHDENNNYVCEQKAFLEALAEPICLLLSIEPVQHNVKFTKLRFLINGTIYAIILSGDEDLRADEDNWTYCVIYGYHETD